MRKLIMSVAVLATMLFGGLSLMDINKAEAAVRISRIGYDANNKMYTLTRTYLQEHEAIYTNKLVVEVESDKVLDQRMSFLGTSNNPFTNISGVTTTVSGASYRNGKYYYIYTVTPVEKAFGPKKINNFIPINYTLQFWTYTNYGSTKEQCQLGDVHFE